MSAVLPPQTTDIVKTSRPSDHVLHIEMNRPEARNSVNDALATALAAVFVDFEADPALRVAVLSGRGPGFCAGLDLKAFLHGETGMDPERGFAGIATRPPAKPVIAAVEGFALAGGLEVALACDLIVAGQSARLGLPEVQRGLVADGGGLLRLPERVPHQLAMEIGLLGEPIPVSRAYELGLVARAVADGAAATEALQLAERIGRNAPMAVRATKAIISESRDWPMSEAWRRQGEHAKAVWSSADANEGATAFAEKREPRFTGR